MKKLKFFLFTAFLTSSTVYAQTIQDGLKALDNDQFGKAKSVFQTLLSNKPEVSVEAYFQLANCYFKTEKIDSATIVINRMVTMFPASALSKVATGKLALANKNVDVAKSFFNEALKMTANKDAKVMQWIADSYLSVEKADGPGALQILAPAIKLDPKNPDLYILSGDAYKLDQTAGGPAVTNYEKVLEMNALTSKANQRIGVIYMQARNFQSSSDAFEKSLANDKNYAPAYRDYAMLNYYFKRYEKARSLYEQYLSLADTTEIALTRYVYILFQVKDYQKATEQINDLMQRDASNNLLNRLLAFSYSEQKKDSIGLIYMKKFLSNVDTSKIIILDYKYYGRMLSRTGEDSLGIMQLRKALAYDSTDVDILQDLGEALNRTKKYCEAAAVFQQKVTNSKSPSALDYFFLTKAYYYCKDYVMSDSTAQKIIDLRPNSHIGWQWRGKSTSKIYVDDVEKPYPFYLKAGEIVDSVGTKVPSNEAIEIYKFLAVYYIKKDDNEKAKMYAQKILARDPNDKDALDFIKQLK